MPCSWPTASARHGSPEPFAANHPSARPAFFEPTTLLSAVSMVARRIGVVATATSTYDEPWMVARRFASMDHVSKGRAGWTWSPRPTPATHSTSAVPNIWAARIAMPAPRNCTRSLPSYGTAGRTTPSRRTRQAAGIPIRARAARRPSRHPFHRERAVEHLADAARSARRVHGRAVGSGHGAGCPLCRRPVRRRDHQAGLHRRLCRHQRPHGALWPGARHVEDPARNQAPSSAAPLPRRKSCTRSCSR